MSTDILLVNPVFLSQNEAERDLMSPYFPLGLLYLAAFLRQSGFSVEVFDGTFQENITDFETALRVHQPAMVGISVVQPNRETAFELARIAKQHRAAVTVGGPDPTLKPQEYLTNSDIDYVVHHEGELTFVELLDFLRSGSSASSDLAGIDGIAYRLNGGPATVNPRRPFILNLDELPTPARDMIDMDRYLQVWKEHNGYSSLTISLSRGCPFGCEWCQNAVHGAKLRQRSPESVVAEVKSIMKQYDIDRLRVVDDVDGIDRQWIETWEEVARAQDAVLPFEALNDLERQDIPMLDVRDAL